MSEARWHDLARALEQEAELAGDKHEQRTLKAAAAILRRRGDTEAEIRKQAREKQIAGRRR